MIDVLRHKTADQVRIDVAGFSSKYADDWERWLSADVRDRPAVFGRILRSWQATRPHTMRRLRGEATHEAPYLDDVIDAAADAVLKLGDVTVRTIRSRTRDHDSGLHVLWEVLSQLPVSATASCVGITKGALLLTDGRIGPALDSQVRKQLGVHRVVACDQWIALLDQVADDIAAFEASVGPLAAVVPPQFAHLCVGRLYDMALGPR